MKKMNHLSFLLMAALLLAGCVSQRIRITAPADGAEECLLKPIQLKFVQMPREERRAYFADPACRAEMSSQGFHPRKVTLSWESDNPSSEYTVTVSTTPDFAPDTCTKYTTGKTSLDIDNLMIATTYYWTVSDGTRSSKPSTFVTADIAPRLIRVPNVWNVRDLGGRIGLDGRRVKQNMVFRTGGLNNNASLIYYTFDELLEASESARRTKASLEKALALIESKADVMMPSLASREWTVYRPAKKRFTENDLTEIFGYRDIPESIMGAAGVKMTGSSDTNAIRFDPFEDSLPAVFMQVIDAPEDGLVPFQCGADWYWRLAVNGDVVYDRWTGNGMATAKDNFVLALPVKKGSNLVTVALGSGSGGFAWHYGPVDKDIPNEKIVENSKKIIGEFFNKKTKVVKLDADGNQMFVKGNPTCTEEGRRYMLDVMHIRSDIDLRSDGECMGMTGSPLGDDVIWYHISSSAYGGITSSFGREAFTNVFKVFLDETNYPIDFHCIAGQDRTGAVAFIINGLLGVSEEELYLDWEVTGYWNNSVAFAHKSHFDHLVAAFDKFDGETINERIENYVLSLGFTHDDIQHLRDIMLEP